MSKIKTVLLFTSWLYFNFVIAQDITSIPDSLKRYSYLDLNDKILKNIDNDTASYRKKCIYAKTCLLKAQKENNTEEIIYAFTAMSSVMNKFEIALKYSDSAFSIARKKMPNRLSYLYYHRGYLYYDVKKLKNALNCFLTANKDSIYLNTKLRNRVQYSIGLIKNTQGEYKEALHIYKKCEETARKNKLPDYLVYLFGLSEIYNRTNNIALSEKHTNTGLSLCETYRSGFYCPYFISNRGKNYYKRKQYDKAIADLINLLQSFRNNQDYSNYAENSYYLGECFLKLNQEEKAIKIL
jgi:tetratricopeptide (TPR) repeat protein